MPSRPRSKVYYNLTITGLSVAVALIIGTVELLGLVGEKLDLRGPFWDWVGGLDLNIIGYLIVATWIVAFAVWRFGRIEEQWTANLQSAEGSDDSGTRR